jgi:NitT/TauT family transport system ATP-binding protein
LRTEIVSIWRKTGKTIVFVTHDVEEALVLADRILLLSNKPTRVIETIMLDMPRPRSLDADACLTHRRQELMALFANLEPERAHA